MNERVTKFSFICGFTVAFGYKNTQWQKDLNISVFRQVEK